MKTRADITDILCRAGDEITPAQLVSDIGRLTDYLIYRYIQESLNPPDDYNYINLRNGERIVSDGKHYIIESGTTRRLLCDRLPLGYLRQIRDELIRKEVAYEEWCKQWDD